MIVSDENTEGGCVSNNSIDVCQVLAISHLESRQESAD